MRASRWLLLGLLCAVPVHAQDVVGDDAAARWLRGDVNRAPIRAQGERLAERSYARLRDEGWMWARVAVDSVTVGVRGGPRATIASLDVRCRDEALALAWRDGSGLREGAILRPGTFERRLRRGLRALGERGHPFASATLVRQEADPETGAIDLAVNVVPGPRLRIGGIVVEGTTHTRPEALARLSGLEIGAWVRESSLEEARLRLRNRPALVRAIGDVELRPRPGSRDEVDVVLGVEQPATTGSFAAAIGAVRDDEDETRISGSVDLVLLDLFGTARAFQGRWSDDGATRRRLDVSYLEPAAFGTGLDLRLEAGQRHEDDAFDTVRGDLRAELPSVTGRTLSISVGLDRTTFIGDEGRARARQRFGGGFGFSARRPVPTGNYGLFRSAVEAARVVDRRRDPEGTGRIEATITQTLVEFDGKLGRALSRTVAVELDVHWRSTETDALPVPRSEQWALGGATTVRGYAEDRFLGERTAWGGLEVVLGPAGGGQGFVFYDAGWVRTTGETSASENRLRGFGVGLRSPTALGSVDLSLGFAERIGFDAGKLHLVLVRGF